MSERRFVSYLRVSTQRQGRSGLGLEAQRKAVEEYLNGGEWEHVAEFLEVETGKDDSRPELSKALAACRIHGATLVVAKLDRLARNAAFLLSLQNAGVDFVCADMPEANRLTVGILAVVAEDEAHRISERTKAALQAAKARGVTLGTPENLTDKARMKGTKASVEVRSNRARRRAEDLAPLMRDLQGSGMTSLRELAAALEARRIPTPRGNRNWSAMQVRRLLKRIDELEAPSVVAC